MAEPVLTKQDMWKRLIAGDFGNTLPRWTSVWEWAATHLDKPLPWLVKSSTPPLWGVQSTRVPSFQGTRLDVPKSDVIDVVRSNFQWKDYVLSPMAHQFGNVVWEGNIFDGPNGLACEGNLAPANGSWRSHMLKPRRWERSAAYALIKHFANDNSRHHIFELLDSYDDHVVEVSIMDACIGTVPHHNAICHEVRKY